MPITQEQLDTLDPQSKQQAMEIIAELERRRSKTADAGIANRQTTGGFLPKVANALSFALRGNTMDTGNDASEKINTLMATEAIKNKLNPPKYQPTTREEAIEFEREKLGVKAENKTASEKKAELDLADRERQTKLASDNTLTAAQDTLNTIEEVKKGLKYFGVVGKVPTLNPWGFERKEWESNINKLLSQKIVDLMNTMKQASRTGATGFGQLNKSELLLLQNASTALRKDLSPEQAKKYLDGMEAIAKKIATPSMGIQEDNVPTFATEEEAEMSGHKGDAIIAGRRARIE